MIRQDIPDTSLKTSRTPAYGAAERRRCAIGRDAPAMSKARLVITAIEIEGRSVTEVAKSYEVSRSWIYELLARYRTEGDAAFEPRSRRPHSQRRRRSPQTTVDLIVLVRKQLAEVGLDAGPTPSPGT